jgi:zinc transporter, ZIP family
MANLGAATLWGLAAVASLLLGAAAAVRLHLPPRLAEVMSAAGAGVLVGAVVLELLPEAGRAGTLPAVSGVLLGTALAAGAAAVLERRVAPGGDETTRGEAIAAGLVVDGVPESLAVGFSVAQGRMAAALLAGVLMGNLAEAYSAARPIVVGGRSGRFAFGVIAAVAAILLVATVLGGTLLAGADPRLIGSAQALAAGAVLWVVALSLRPPLRRQPGRTAALVGACGGFALAVLLSVVLPGS